jgi:hypothetical protein
MSQSKNLFRSAQQRRGIPPLMEEAYRDRDALLVEIDGIIKSSRDLLLGVYGNTPND